MSWVSDVYINVWSAKGYGYKAWLGVFEDLEMSLIMGLAYFGLDMVISVLGLKSEFWRPLLGVEVQKNLYRSMLHWGWLKTT